MPLHWFLLLMYTANSKHRASMPRFHFGISLSFPACSVAHIMERGRQGVREGEEWEKKEI
jgi:hypothetical protein